MYFYWRMNDDSDSIFDAEQHPEIHLAGNYYSLALICKESTNTHIRKTDFAYCNAIWIRRIRPKLWQKCYLEQPLHISIQNSKLLFSVPTTYFFSKKDFRLCVCFLR